MSQEQSYQLWDQYDGQTLTPLGWMPDASVEEQRRKTVSLANWAWGSGGIGLILCGPLSLVGIVLGLAARARGVKWGVPVGWGAVILSSIAAVVWLAIATAYVSSSLNATQTQTPQFQPVAPQVQETVIYLPARVEVGTLSADEFGFQTAPVTITNPARNSGPCTFVVSVTADSQDGTMQYDSGAVSVNALKPGQSFQGEVMFTNQVPPDAAVNADSAECFPE